MKRFFSFLTGAVMGALVGATVAILFAPSSGEDLRELMKKRCNEYYDELMQAARSRRIELEQQIETLRQPKSTSSAEET